LMDVWRQVFFRSMKMGLMYVILSLVMTAFITVSFGIGANVTNVPENSGRILDIRSLFGLMQIPFVAIFGLIITMPTYMLFVSDKNAGVLEYLLAVGMSQRDIFKGYLKAALALFTIPTVLALIVNLALSTSELLYAASIGALAVVTGLADVALVTFLMTGVSAMQRKPTGFNSPLGVAVGLLLVLPEVFLPFVLQGAVVWLDIGIAAVLLVTTSVLLLSVDRLIMREKLLP